MQELPADVRALLERQHTQLTATADQVSYLRGCPDTRLFVRLADGQEEVDLATEELGRSGFDPDSLETQPLEGIISVYEDAARRSPLRESAVAGGLIGLLTGGLIGLVAGISAWLGVTGSELVALSLLGSISAITAIGAATGALFGAILGAFLGQDVLEQDWHLYADSLAHGSILMLVRAPAERAAEASQVMMRVDAANRAQARPAALPVT